MPFLLPSGMDFFIVFEQRMYSIQTEEEEEEARVPFNSPGERGGTPHSTVSLLCHERPGIKGCSGGNSPIKKYVETTYDVPYCTTMHFR